MPKKKKTLPKHFDQLIEAGDLSALQEVFTKCEYDARGGYSKEPALSFYNVPAELVRWLVEQGADLQATDTYGRTPLHHHARSWCGHTSLLLELGADTEAADYQNETPLFAAHGSFKPDAVRALLAKGANIHARNNRHQTALDKALAECSNSDIVDMAEIASLWLDLGVVITPAMKDDVKRIGSDFEFHRAGFNKDYLEQTDQALTRLYELFDIIPIAKRQMHDGISLITVSTQGWQHQHEELWRLLIPSTGSAQTVQGEVIRITGKISREILGNGGVNWDGEFRKMLRALLHHFTLGTPLSDAQLEEAEALVKQLRNGDGMEEPARLCELAVAWVLLNPQPMTLESPEYTR
ncbi:ankyrin repeat domain-containing protein [Paenibacillus sp. WLX1005]|uniref:ankyrin repeat domain-containing protein n=1 Tax=Paenibacillus sp. WLX1005 TaxID=3243766 RepID=UPI0039844895